MLSSDSSPVLLSGSTVASSGREDDPPLLPDSGGSIGDAVNQSSPPHSTLSCARCNNKVFKTKRNFLKHKVLHIQKDYLQNITKNPWREKCVDIAHAVLKKMSESDSFVNEDSKEFLVALLDCTAEAAWISFVSVVSDFILDIVFQKTNVLPQLQHDRNLKEMATWLGNKNERLQLLESLQLVVNGPANILNPLVYRFCTKMYESVEVEFLKLTQTKSGLSDVPRDITLSLDLDEEQTLYYACGSVVRYFLTKRKTRDLEESDVLKVRRKCISEKLLFNVNDNYSDNFLNLKAWLDKLDRGGLIAVNERGYNFFLTIEYIVRKCFLDSTELHHEWIINELYHPDYNYMTEFWYSVTAGYMSESDSIAMLDVFVKKFVNFSGKAEAGLRRREADGSRMKVVALRTSLKRN